ncbi:hypothetical protein CEXT_765461 [Caerostris extrusa]|uniref:Uncharacterized protein n=1 Tax=Caerostris extrusa TaxID=172846 RepID=A0AAV4MJ63_CAEEX|nr:hypothetical protein CEXT_765461 [Caerostris extrusa]
MRLHRPHLFGTRSGLWYHRPHLCSFGRRIAFQSHGCEFDFDPTIELATMGLDDRFRQMVDQIFPDLRFA